MHITVLQGSTRSQRMGDRAARWVVAQLRARGHDVALVDAAVLQLPVLDKMWKEIKDDESETHSALHEKLAGLAQIYARSDGYVVVSAEYNHSIPPGLSNLIDYFLEEYAFRPAAIVCYSSGSFGGVRAAMQLRSLLPEVGLSSIPSIQAMPQIQDLLDSDGVATDDSLARRSSRFFAEFEWYMRAMANERAVGVPY